MAKANHIWVDFKTHTHHGIDCGDGTVIHYWGNKIKRTSKSKFARGKKIHVRSYHGKSDPEDKAIERTMRRLGEKKYNLISNNCEHFATWCKLGKS